MTAQRTITVAGGNLFAVAAGVYGDARQWYAIAQMRLAQAQPVPLTVAQQLALWDPWIAGTVTLSLPPSQPFAGGTDGILGLP